MTSSDTDSSAPGKRHGKLCLHKEAQPCKKRAAATLPEEGHQAQAAKWSGEKQVRASCNDSLVHVSATPWADFVLMAFLTGTCRA